MSLDAAIDVHAGDADLARELGQGEPAGLEASDRTTEGVAIAHVLECQLKCSARRWRPRMTAIDSRS